MRPRRRNSSALLCGCGAPALLSALVAAWSCAGYEAQPSPFEAEEKQARQRYRSTAVSLLGCLEGEPGLALDTATVRLGDREAKADASGCFRLDGLRRENALVFIQVSGALPEVVPVHLAVALDTQQVKLPIIALSSSRRVRLAFGGDVQLGRRMLDPDQSTPLDRVPPPDPEAHISSSDPLPGSRSIFEHVRPVLRAQDLALVNLETVVTRQPDTPDRDKSFVFFTLPESLPALQWAGIDYVSLANNHTYDYLEAGIIDTTQAVMRAELAWSGSGENVAEAYEPALLKAKGQEFAVFSLSAIEGIQAIEESAAQDDKPGVASLNDDDAIARAMSAIDGPLPIAMVHTGYEYTAQPPDDGYTLPKMEWLVEQGARLVVGHHPHVPQGFSYESGVPIAHSLGNFAFDQQRLETLVATLLQADFDQDGVAQLRARPLAIRDYAPHLLSGAGAVRVVENLAMVSHDYGVTVVPGPQGGLVVQSEWLDKTQSSPGDSRRPEAAAPTPSERRASLSVDFDAHGEALLDLRQHIDAEESLKGLDLSAGAVAARGRNLITSGDMEQYVVGGASATLQDWFYSGLDAETVSGFPCLSHAYRGAYGLCSTRNELDRGDATLSFRRRIRVPGDKLNQPNKALSLLAYVKGVGAGPVRAEVELLASLGDEDFGTTTLFELDPGDYDWQLHRAPIDMPADREVPLATPFSPERRRSSARALRFRFLHSPPLTGDGLFAVDEVAVVSWQANVHSAASWSTPNPWEFLLLQGQPNTSAEVEIVAVSYD